MNLTAAKYFANERAMLKERRQAVTTEIATLNERLTEARHESMLLDDLIARMDAHLPVTIDTKDVVAIKREANK